MQISERWLRDWCNPALDRAQLADAFTQAGIEVEGVEPLPALDTRVVLAQVRSVRQHPNADRLRVCEVDFGSAQPVQVVCGAPNVRAGMHAALATIGAQLPGGLRIKASRLRGEESAGMLCSAPELGLGDDASGLLELPPGPLGSPLHELLQLDDAVFHLSLTPNRGDCLSVRGLARELHALTGAVLTPPDLSPASAATNTGVSVTVQAPADCPRYLCRTVTGVDAAAATPAWLRERLRRAGLRSLGAVVDITNYVLLELGQPLHAFDLDRLRGQRIDVRHAHDGESLTALNGQSLALNAGELVIADGAGPVALAGVIGGADSAVRTDTRDILLESAYFAPRPVSRVARRHGLITEAALRFERNADPAAQATALERATALVLEICGGQAGPVVAALSTTHLPTPAELAVRHTRVQRVLGVSLEAEWCAPALRALGAEVRVEPDVLRVTAPTWRPDWRAEEDLIEELARLHGYANIPARMAGLRSGLPAAPEDRVSVRHLADVLCARGFQEAITYSFGDPATQALCAPGVVATVLANPLSADLAALRTQVWPGLARAAVHNLNRQAGRVRLFEIGRRFLPNAAGKPAEEAVLSALVAGNVQADGWAQPSRAVDFFDLKADLEALCDPLDGDWSYVPADHPALHPGQSAWVLHADVRVGLIGRLHPQVEQALELPATFVMEVDLDALRARRLPRAGVQDRFPSVRRDLALTVPDGVPAAAITATIAASAGEALRECVLFDVYRGKGVPAGTRSLAFGLRLAHTDRTLTDQETDAVVERVMHAVTAAHGARLREQHGGPDQS